MRAVINVLTKLMLLQCRHLLRRGFSSCAIRSLTSDGRRLVLGIESSCDDSCASLVSAPAGYFQSTFEGAKIHTSVVMKQDHGITRGIEPLNAANAHSAKIPLAIRQCLLEGIQDGVIKDHCLPVEIDAIAVTQGPGMAASLAQGMSNAKLLSTLWSKPLIYTHHMVAHTLTPYMVKDVTPIKMPFLVFLLSGGHTQLVLCKSPQELQILATSKDDSIGDAFDKVARMLEIQFDWSKTSPGAALESFASHSEDNRFKLPIPFRNEPAFSYSGLKSAVQRLVPLASSEQDRKALAYSLQKAAFAQIEDKVQMIFQGSMSSTGESITDLVLSGGVASNEYLRKTIKKTLLSIGREDVRLHFPPVSLCTDNAAMIAHAGLISWNLTHDLTAIPRAKWSVEEA